MLGNSIKAAKFRPPPARTPARGRRKLCNSPVTPYIAIGSVTPQPTPPNLCSRGTSRARAGPPSYGATPPGPAWPHRASARVAPSWPNLGPLRPPTWPAAIKAANDSAALGGLNRASHCYELASAFELYFVVCSAQGRLLPFRIRASPTTPARIACTTRRHSFQCRRLRLH